MDILSPKSAIFELATELETKKSRLMIARDVAALAELLSQDLYYVHSNGLKDTKEIVLKNLWKGNVVYSKLDAQLDEVVALGTSAFQAHGRLFLEVTLNGVERKFQTLILVVWRQENGTWRLLSQQSTLPAAGISTQ